MINSMFICLLVLIYEAYTKLLWLGDFVTDRKPDTQFKTNRQQSRQTNNRW